ncbi:PPM1D-like protein [Mya arenaria]|uniref:PPM1D-like protein n=1 Tax=Mya arenaria TaxID=6604 RepID=A0ABY7E225_MYAAR|nr:PPM1D-like protein [Mya arenaria]
MSSYRIGMNLRVTEDSNQGGRRYMEDRHAIRFVKNEEGGFEFAYFGIFDGHGGGEASKYARDYLLDEITKYDCFWSDNDDDILYAIKSAFLDTHYGMWKEVDKWPKTGSGLPSTAGTTASIAIIKNSKLYIGHDHKPDDPTELARIESSGGQVVAKSGVQRVVWNRDLWSYNYFKEEFVVSPEPDVCVHKLDPSVDKCLVIGSDGLWNMLSADESVHQVFDLENQFEHKVINDPTVPLSYWINPAERLVQAALTKWRMRMMKADNTSAIVVLIDPLGPRKLSILRKKREERMKELAEKRINNSKSVSDMLTANETLHKPSPKRHGDKEGENSFVNVKVMVKGKETPQAPNFGLAPQKSPASPSLDDSIQLRNGHVISPVSASKNQDVKHIKSAPVVKDKPQTVVSHSTDNLANGPTRMATRLSPQKSPLGQNSASQNSPNVQNDMAVKSICGKANSAPAKSNSVSPSQQKSVSPNQQKCLQPSKGTSENVKNVTPPKLQTGMKVKDLENLYASVVQFNKGHLNVKTNQKCNKTGKNLNNSSTPSEGLRSTKKPHSTKSLSTRISLRLRRLRQRSVNKNKSQRENKSILSTKTGIKRKLDSGQSNSAPALKKIKHS